jgi:hypothetical protein
VSEKPITHGETAVKIPTISVAHFACSALENAKLAIAIAGASIQAVHAALGTPLKPNAQGDMKRMAANTRAPPLSTAFSVSFIVAVTPTSSGSGSLPALVQVSERFHCKLSLYDYAKSWSEHHRMFNDISQ